MLRVLNRTRLNVSLKVGMSEILLTCLHSWNRWMETRKQKACQCLLLSCTQLHAFEHLQIYTQAVP